LHYEPCQTCDGGGATFRLDENGDVENKPCIDCKGTGYEQPADTREDDAYEQSREDEGADDAF
jgi:DnaJ-class molecular chaperone